MAQAVLTCPQNLATEANLQLSSACASLQSALSRAVSNGATNAVLGATVVLPALTEAQVTAVAAAGSVSGYILGSQNFIPGTTYASLVPAAASGPTQTSLTFGVSSTRSTTTARSGFGFGTIATSASAPSSAATRASETFRSSAVTTRSSSEPSGFTTSTSTSTSVNSSGTGSTDNGDGITRQASTFTTSGPNGLVTTTSTFGAAGASETEGMPSLSSSSGGTSKGVIIGAVVGSVLGLALLLLLAVLLFCVVRRRRRRGTPGQPLPYPHGTDTLSPRPEMANSSAATDTGAGVGLLARQHAGSTRYADSAASGLPLASRSSGVSDRAPTLPAMVALGSTAFGSSLQPQSSYRQIHEGILGGVGSTGHEEGSSGLPLERAFDHQGGLFQAADSSGDRSQLTEAEESGHNDSQPPTQRQNVRNAAPSHLDAIGLGSTDGTPSEQRSHENAPLTQHVELGSYTTVPASGPNAEAKAAEAAKLPDFDDQNHVHATDTEPGGAGFVATGAPAEMEVIPPAFANHQSGSAAQFYYNIPKASETGAVSKDESGSPRTSRILFGRSRRSSDQSGQAIGISSPGSGGSNEDSGYRFFPSAFSSGRSSRRQSVSTPSKPIVSDFAPVLPNLDHLGDFDPLFGSIKPRLGAAAPNKVQDMAKDGNLTSLPETSDHVPDSNVGRTRGVSGLRPTTITTSSGPGYVSTTTTTGARNGRDATALAANPVIDPLLSKPALEKNSNDQSHNSPIQSLRQPVQDANNASSPSEQSSGGDLGRPRFSQGDSTSAMSSPSMSINASSALGSGSRPITPANHFDNDRIFFAAGKPGTTPPFSNLNFTSVRGSGSGLSSRGHLRNQSEPLPSKGTGHLRNFSDMSNGSILSIPESEPEVGTAYTVPVPRKSSKRVSARYYYPPPHETGGFDFQFDEIRQGPYGSAVKSEPNTAYQTARVSTEELDRSYDDSDLIHSTQSARMPTDTSNQITRKPVSSTARRLLDIVNTPRSGREAFE